MNLPKKERLMTPREVSLVFGRDIKGCDVFEVVTVGEKGKEKHYSYIMKPHERFAA